MYSGRRNSYDLTNPSLPGQINQCLSLSSHLLIVKSVTVTVIECQKKGLENVTDKSSPPVDFSVFRSSNKLPVVSRR